MLNSRGEFSGIYKNYKGIQVLGTVLYVPETNWEILSEKSVKEAFLQIARIKYIFAIAGGVASLIVFIFAFIVSNNINVIITKLIKGAKRIACGDLEHLITVGKRGDEIGELSEPFIEMSRKLKTVHEKLEEHSRTLKQKVKERTIELTKANIKLLEQDELKTEFLSTVSHELRTPLALVLGFTKIISRKLEKAIFPHVKEEDSKVKKSLKSVREDLNTIASEGNRLTKLIDDLLDITKIEAGKVVWGVEFVSVVDILERATTVTTNSFKHNGLVLIKNYDSGLPLIVGDKYRLEQVVINLISNAVKFTEKGTITCMVKKLKDEIKVSVVDTGIGIPEKDKEKVFEKFIQTDDRLTDKPEGTGLEQSTLFEIAEMIVGEEEQDIIGTIVSRHVDDSFMRIREAAFHSDCQL